MGNDQKRIVLCRVDNSKPYKRTVIINQERMPNKYDNNKDIECAKVRHSPEKNASDLINIYKQIVKSI